MGALLEIPTPRGDLGVMRESASLLDRYARDIDHGARDLARVDAMVGSEWMGESADAFALQSVQARRALTEIAGTHRETAAVIREYAEQWDYTRKLANQTKVEVAQAVESYGRQAHSAVNGLLGVLQRAEQNAVVDKITDVAADVVSVVAPDFGRFIRNLEGWTPPARRPHLYVVTDDYVEPVNAEKLLGLIRGGAEWGISHLLHGIEAVAKFIGQAVSSAVSVFQKLEDWLANAVARARKMLKSAFDKLFALGRKAAAAIARIAVAAVQAAYDFAATVVRAGVDFLIKVGKAVKAVIDFGLQVVKWMGAQTGRAILKMLELTARRRIPHPLRLVLDKQAQQRWLTDPSYQKAVRDYFRLADNAYAHGVNSELPAPWEPLPGMPRTGADGFSATVYFNEHTKQYVIAFRGTQMGGDEGVDSGDIVDDVQNGLLNMPTDQVKEAIKLAKEIAREHGAENVHLTGHSLGGSLAAAASLATGIGATTFNAAGVGNGNYAQAVAAGGKGLSETQITNFHTPMDAATVGQNLAGGLGVHSAAGAQVTLNWTGGQPLDAHGRPQLYEGLKL